MENKKNSNLIINSKNQNDFATIKDIEKISLQIEEIKLSINKKEDDLKNIINEKDIIIKKLEQKLLNQENKIKNNENEIQKLKNKIDSLNNKKYIDNLIIEKKLNKKNNKSKEHQLLPFSYIIRKEISILEYIESGYGFLSSIGVKILPPKHDYSQIEGFIKAPDNSPYKDGIFNFVIKFPYEYPKAQPQVFLKTKILHTECLDSDGRCCISFLNYWNQNNSLLEIICILYEFFAYQTFNGYQNDASKIFKTKNISLFKEKCQEYVKKYAYKEFNNEYDYLFKNSIDINKFYSDDFTLIFFCIENGDIYKIRIDKYEADKPVYYYIGHYISPLLADKALIVGNKVFHSSISIKECIKSRIIFMIPMLEEFSYYNTFIKNELINKI